MPRLSRLLLAAVAAIALPSSAPAAEPVKMAESARFDLKADASVRSIDQGRSLEGGGTVDRMNWVAEAERARGYTVNFPVGYRGWKTAAIRFTPTGSGTVTLTLMGPYQQARPGVLYRQEILWDDVRVEGATLAGRGFETGARTWHNQTLSAAMTVVAGRPVTIRLNARAVRPEGFVEMKRLDRRSTPADRAARRFLRGANFGNDLEVPPDQTWAVHHTPADVHRVKAEGFDHIRIPAGWHHYTGPGPAFSIRPEFFARADALVNAALEDGLAVMINIHHFDDFTTDPKAQASKFVAIWEQIAAHYAKAPEGLALELLNEPKDAATTEVINPIYAEAIRAIRKHSPARTIFVGPGRWNSVDELNRLRLPDDDANLIVTVHSYDPFFFTHQGATWAGPDTRTTGIRFPGPPRTPLEPDPSLKLSQSVRGWIARYNTEPTADNPCAPHVIQEAVDKAAEWSTYYGRPIHFGEFGCFTTADPESRANYYRTFRQAAEKAGIGWAIWDWKAGFRYWDATNHRPMPGMREALFGRSMAATSR